MGRGDRNIWEFRRRFEGWKRTINHSGMSLFTTLEYETAGRQNEGFYVLAWRGVSEATAEHGTMSHS